MTDCPKCGVDHNSAIKCKKRDVYNKEDLERSYGDQKRDELARIKAIHKRVGWSKDGGLSDANFHYAGDCEFLLGLLERGDDLDE